MDYELEIHTQSTLDEVNIIITCFRNGCSLNIIKSRDYGQVVVYKAGS